MSRSNRNYCVMMLVFYYLILASWTAIQCESRDFIYPDGTGDQFRDHHHHHQFEEDPYLRGNSKQETVPAETTGLSYVNTSSQIPLDFARSINGYSVNDLLLNFVDGDVEEEPMFIQDRFGGEEGQERSATAIRPKEAACIPEMTTIKIVENTDPTVFYIPQCTRVERCGGCCSHPLLKCQPEEKESLNLKVVKTQYTGAHKLKLVAKEIVTVDKHTKCKCDCRIQPEDCKPFQEYQKNECKCTCTNFEEEKKCAKNNQTKLWNPDLCTCQCRYTTACTTGSVFDYNECKCKPIPMKRRFADFENAEQPPTLQIDQDY